MLQSPVCPDAPGRALLPYICLHRLCPQTVCLCRLLVHVRSHDSIIANLWAVLVSADPLLASHFGEVGAVEEVKPLEGYPIKGGHLFVDMSYVAKLQEHFASYLDLRAAVTSCCQP